MATDFNPYSHYPTDYNTGMLDWWDEGIDTGYNTYPSTLTEQLCYSTILTNGEESEEPEPGPGPEPTHDYSKDYLTFRALESNSTVSVPVIDDDITIQYSVDGGESWLEAGTSTNITLNDVGDVVLFKSNISDVSQLGSSGSLRFNGSGKLDVEGNIMSLLYEDEFEDEKTVSIQYAFGFMFSGCTSIIDASNLILPTTLSYNCCNAMFSGCTGLTAAPKLQSTLIDGCYEYMFQGCTSLTTAPELPATTLAYRCYSGMFSGCTSLTAAPELRAQTLISMCYFSMFNGCTSLVTAPELPATTLEQDCYTSMFRGCTSLTTAPELPAQTLAQGCYNSMFQGCTSLNYIKCLATDISAQNCTIAWVQDVSSTGTFVKDASMTDWKTGTYGTPNGWTVEDAE